MFYSARKGFTLVELLVVISILSLLFGATIAIINPPQILAKGKDAERLANLAILSSAIHQYIIDNGTPPGPKNVTRLSDFLPQGQAGPLQNPSSGWIEGDFRKYTNKLFTDPINSGNFVYRYKHDGIYFELDCLLEIVEGKADKDMGNDLARYEVGTKLTLL